MILCFSTFAKEYEDSMQGDNSDFEVGTLLLGWVTDHEEVVDRKGQPIDITAPMISDLFSRKTEIHKAIRTYCSKQGIWKEAVEFCKKDLLGSVIPTLFHDFFFEVGNLIKNDKTIAPEKKKELLDYNNKGQKAEFVAAVLLYVLTKNNNRISGSSTKSEDVPLLNMFNFCCPICHKPLIQTIRDMAISDYQIVKIFPDDVVFNTVSKPEHMEESENLIPLCSQHAEEYTDSPTEQVCNVLFTARKKAELGILAAEQVNKATLEKEIRILLERIKNMACEEDLVELSMKAMKIEDKIPSNEYLLRMDETARVVKFYNYVNTQFSLLERDIGEETLDFDQIASEVRVAYKKLTKKGLGYEDIVKQLTKWVLIQAQLGNDYQRAAEIVIAFFIQNCEVFDALSK